MPVHMGIMCEKCRRVHFVGSSPGIKPVPTPGMYALTCPFCLETREFRKETMHPYRISDEVFKTGYAKEGEYQPIEGTNPPQPPQGR